MQSTKLPAGLDEVAGSLEEAAGYERLALERRKGLFGLISAAMMVAAFAWISLVDDFNVTDLATAGFFAAVFALSFSLRLLRKRPGWAPIFEQPRGRKFWIRYLVSITLLFTAVLLLGVFVFDSASAAFGAGFIASTFAAGGAILLWLAPRHSPVRYSIFVGGTVAAIFLFSGIVPPAHYVEALIGSMALASIAEATFRLVAPRRWLV